MTWPRCILHMDMDAFYAAAEVLDDPNLTGKPLLIGHDGPRGVVSTASYEARVFGCRSAMPMVTAKRLCPQALVLPVRMARYQELSSQIFTILEDFSPLIEPLSIDEAFLDLTGAEHLFGSGAQAARRIKERIRAEVGLTASVGVAACKFLAKLASDLEKPDGLTVIGPVDIDRILPPLPVSRLWGVGKVTAGRMEQLGIRTIGDLRRRGLDWLLANCGNDAQRLWELAHGVDDRAVVPDREAKSIGHEQTFETDLADREALLDVLYEQVQQVGGRLRRHGLCAGGVSLKLRYGDFTTLSRSRKLKQPTDVTRELWTVVRAIFDEWSADFRPLRLLGMTAERLTPADDHQTLFPDPDQQKEKRLDALTDRINARFGKGSIRRGGA